MTRFHHNQFLRALAFTFAVALVAGCSDDDDPTGGGTTDTTPPSVASVTAVDGNHIDVVYNENVQRESAEDVDNYIIIETTIALAELGSVPGDTLIILGAALGSDQKTVSLSTDPMLDAPYDLSVTGVKDASGNTIVTPVVSSFTGSTDPDLTAPELVYRSPGPNATGVPVGTQILLTFSEPVTYVSFINGFTLTSESSGDVSYLGDSNDNVHVVVWPTSPLELGTEHLIALTGIQDNAGNVMSDVNWTFTTTNTEDTTPPTLVSTFPANGTTNVDVGTYLSLTFSEPIDQSTLAPSLFPDAGDGDFVWSNGGKTITFTPYSPLLDNQQYTLTTIPGSFADASGNWNTQFNEARFTTGNALATGSFAGTVSGDPASDYADDPTGARVFAAVNLLGDDILFGGSALIAGNNTFDVRNLSDSDYIALSVMDSNNDGVLDPNLGDAVGAYGVDFELGDTEPDFIGISGGNRVTGIDFQLWDFSAISGTVSYSGIVKGSHFVGIGLFATSGFDPSNEPDFTTDASWPGFPEWGFLNVDYSIPDGSYYVGAFLDANDNFTLDLGSEPIGFYGGLPTPTAITIQNGSDRNGVVIPLADPPTVQATGGSVTWRGHTTRATPAWVNQLSKAIKASEGRRLGFTGDNARREGGSAVAAPEVSTRTGWGR
jgi:Bacterial Ig-like domain